MTDLIRRLPVVCLLWCLLFFPGSLVSAQSDISLRGSRRDRLLGYLPLFRSTGRQRTRGRGSKKGGRTIGGGGSVYSPVDYYTGYVVQSDAYYGTQNVNSKSKGHSKSKSKGKSTGYDNDYYLVHPQPVQTYQVGYHPKPEPIVTYEVDKSKDELRPIISYPVGDQPKHKPVTYDFDYHHPDPGPLNTAEVNYRPPRPVSAYVKPAYRSGKSKSKSKGQRGYAKSKSKSRSCRSRSKGYYKPKNVQKPGYGYAARESRPIITDYIYSNGRFVPVYHPGLDSSSFSSTSSSESSDYRATWDRSSPSRDAILERYYYYGGKGTSKAKSKGKGKGGDNYAKFGYQYDDGYHYYSYDESYDYYDDYYYDECAETFFQQTLYPTLVVDTEVPTISSAPTTTPTMAPTLSPTVSPTQAPTQSPTAFPTMAPTKTPTMSPTMAPTKTPTMSPTLAPTGSPTVAPTKMPTVSPTMMPTGTPTASPTALPTATPTTAPTISPTTAMPTTAPTGMPTIAPTVPEETMQPTPAEETTPPTAAEETTPPTQAEETTAPTVAEETTPPTTSEETTAPTVPEETTAPTPPEETTPPTPPEETMAPTVMPSSDTMPPTGALDVVVPFQLEYFIDASTSPSDSDISTVETVTQRFIEEILLLNYDFDTSTSLDDLGLEVITNVDENGRVTIDFEATASFGMDSTVVPTFDDVEAQIAAAFMDVNNQVYLDLLQNLPGSNAFESATEVNYLGATAPTRRSSFEKRPVAESFKLTAKELVGVIGSGFIVLLGMAVMYWESNKRKADRRRKVALTL